MFENSLLNSSSNSGQSRRSWVVGFSLGIQATALSLFVAVPLIYPATLPGDALRPRLTSIALFKKPQIKVQPKPQAPHVENSSAVSAPAHAVYVEQTRGGSMAATLTTPIDDGPPVLMTSNGTMGSTSIIGLGSGTTGSGPIVVARASAPKDNKALPISSGVMAGRLLRPIEPIYPRLAVSIHLQGAVVVTATIDKQGRIVGLQVLSGPEMLRTAAVDAVKEARYNPFLLNGEPTEVTTTITVNFRMGA